MRQKIFNLRKLKSESIDKNKPAYYWVPLLGQYTGARLNELCQLYVNDIKEIDKIIIQLSKVNNCSY